MTSTTATIDRDRTYCSECGQLFTDPKLLPCGHLLCCQCAINWLTTHDQAGCPLCQNVIINCPTSQLKSVEEIVHDLPTDVSMENLVHAELLLNNEHNCCVCDGVMATAMCLHCGDMLCNTCKTAHGKLSALKHHIVEDLSSLTKEKLATNLPSTCSTHPDESSKFFCNTHGRSLCLLCVMSTHKTCTDVEDLEEKMEEAHEVLTQLADTLKAGEAELQKGIEDLDHHLLISKQRLTAAKAEIDHMCDRLNSLVKEHRQRLKEELQNAFRQVQEAVEESKFCLVQRQVKVTSHGHVVERVQRLTDYDDVHVMTPVLEARTHDLDYSVTLPPDAKVIGSLAFNVNTQALSAIEKTLKVIGQVKVTPSDIFANQLPTLLFSDHHGGNVRISEGGKRAERSSNASDNAIVLSRQPLHYDCLYEVRVDKWENTYVQGSMCVGVLTQPPHSLPLPAWSGHFQHSAIVARKNWVKNCITGSQVSSGYGSALSRLGEGSRVGVVLDAGRCLHLYVDGKDQGVMARDVPRPCFALFDVCDDTKMVTALPVTRLLSRQATSSPQLLAIPTRETSM